MAEKATLEAGMNARDAHFDRISGPECISDRWLIACLSAVSKLARPPTGRENLKYSTHSSQVRDARNINWTRGSQPREPRRLTLIITAVHQPMRKCSYYLCTWAQGQCRGSPCSGTSRQGYREPWSSRRRVFMRRDFPADGLTGTHTSRVASSWFRYTADLLAAL